MTGVVVQVRTGSTRLPGKALLPLGGTTLTDQVLRRLALVHADAYVLATDETSAPALAPIASRCGFSLLIGPAEDVLSRYCLALRRFDLDLVVRATGDNPLVSFELASLLLDRRAVQVRVADFLAHTGMPVGMGVELVSASALLRAEDEARSATEREHVCPYIYGHPDLFVIDRHVAPAAYSLPEPRVTVDTAFDYEIVQAIYATLYKGQPIPSLELMKLLRSYPDPRDAVLRHGGIDRGRHHTGGGR